MISVRKSGVETKSMSEVGVTRGLVSWYPLEKDTKDYADVNDAVNNGATLTGDGYSFDGTASLSAPTALSTTAEQEWTVTALVKITDNTYFQQFNNFNNGINLVHGSTKKGLLYLNGGTNDSYTYTSSVMPINEWIHMAYVHRESDQTCRIYLNGTPFGISGNYDATDNPSGLPTTTVFGINFVGKMKHVKVHDVVLTQEEVAMEHKLLTNPDSKVSMTSDCVYVTGQFKEV